MPAPVLVCLHGLGRSSSDWERVRPRLEQFGAVHAPELPRDFDRAYRVAAAAVARGTILVGHSMGAIIAMRLAGEPGSTIRGVVLTGSFFPPARNGRSLGSTIAGYAGHRLAFVRGLRASDRLPGSGRGRVRGLGLLARTALAGSSFRASMSAIPSPVLVVHAVDDHYVPLDFALAAVAGQPAWEMAVLDRGGHYPHVSHPEDWLAVVEPWLERLSSRPP